MGLDDTGEHDSLVKVFVSQHKTDHESTILGTLWPTEPLLLRQTTQVQERDEDDAVRDRGDPK